MDKWQDSIDIFLDRRTGGLEMKTSLAKSKTSLDRRTGGLEIIL